MDQTSLVANLHSIQHSLFRCSSFFSCCRSVAIAGQPQPRFANNLPKRSHHSSLNRLHITFTRRLHVLTHGAAFRSGFSVWISKRLHSVLFATVPRLLRTERKLFIDRYCNSLKCPWNLAYCVSGCTLDPLPRFTGI